MEIITAVIVQVILLVLALSITALRCFVRIKIEARALTLSDYLVWVGWLFTVGWAAAQCKSLYILIDHPLAEATYSDSVDYLQIVFISGPLFDIGLYFPKFSIVAFYWWLVPGGFRNLRIALYINAALVVAAFLVSVICDFSSVTPISLNWSLDWEDQDKSLWNNYPLFIVNWCLNFATDLLLFIFPFFMLKSLKLRQRQTIGLIGVFSLGLITMVMSLARFIVYTTSNYDLSDADGAVWCTAEMCTALIVASLPGLKALITKKIHGGSGLGSSGYTKTSDPTHSQSQTQSRFGKISARLQRNTLRDDESAVELVSMDPLAADYKAKRGPQITVTSDVSVERDEQNQTSRLHMNAINVPV